MGDILDAACPKCVASDPLHHRLWTCPGLAVAALREATVDADTLRTVMSVCSEIHHLPLDQVPAGHERQVLVAATRGLVPRHPARQAADQSFEFLARDDDEGEGRGLSNIPPSSSSFIPGLDIYTGGACGQAAHR